MSDKSLVDAAMMMDRNVSSIDEAAREILRSLKQVSNETADLSSDSVSFFYDEVTRIVLDWMGSGEVDQVRDLLGHIRGILNDEAEDVRCLDSLSPNNQLTIRLQSLGQFMATFLRTSNLSKYIGLLSGKRRGTWRKALKWIYEYDQPVRTSDLCENDLFVRNNTADNALNQLTAIGLLDKHQKEEDGKAVYELTWAGRSVCKTLPDDIPNVSDKGIVKRQQKAPVKVIQLPPKIMANCRRAQEVVEESGLWPEAKSI